MARAAAGHHAYLEGDLDVAATKLAEGSHPETAPALMWLMCLSLESIVEAERGSPRRSRELAELAVDVATRHGLRAIPQSSMAFTALGNAQAADGETGAAMSTLEEGLALRRINPLLGPWATIHHFLVMARVAHAADQLETSGELAREAAALLDTYGAGMLQMHARLAAVQDLLRAERAGGALGDALTDRERDVLRLLAGSLSLGEIARELHLSFNTVKTHTQAVYRKLGAHSRPEAVAIGRRNGFR
jgi:DNA-binding CsgD family transcriptional regulator